MIRKMDTQKFALVCLFSGVAAIALAPILVRLSETGPVATAFWRLCFALPLLWAGTWLSARRNADVLPRSGSDWMLMAAAGLFFAADLGIWHWSLRLTTVANATLLANFAPVFVVLGGRLFFGEHIRPLFVAGMAAALAGMVLVVGPHLRVNLTRFWGDVLGFSTAVFYAGYLLSVKRLRCRFSTMVVMACTGTATAGGLWAAMRFTREQTVPQTANGWLVLLALAIISHAAGQGLIAYALAHLKAGFSSVGLMLQPVLAGLLAWVLFGEILMPVQWIGCLLVLFGIGVARKESG